MEKLHHVKDKIVDSVLIQAHTGLRKPVLWHFLQSAHIGKNIGKVMLKYWKFVDPLLPGGKKGHTYLS